MGDFLQTLPTPPNPPQDNEMQIYLYGVKERYLFFNGVKS